MNAARLTNHPLILLLAGAAAAASLAPRRAAAVDGSRLLVEVAGGVLQARGVSSPHPSLPPVVRPYLNVIHDHWRNIESDPAIGLPPFAFAQRPDISVPPTPALARYDLTLTLIAAQKWVDPPLLPLPGTTPMLQPLAPGETIWVETVNSDVSSDSLGTLLLSVSTPPTGIDAVLLNYRTNRLPANEIDLLTFRLSARPADPSQPDLVADSDLIYVILAPDSTNGMADLSQAAIFLERRLAGQVPEPGGLLLAVASFGATLRRPARRRRHRLVASRRHPRLRGTRHS
jgi:hypothetical protein